MLSLAEWIFYVVLAVLVVPVLTFCVQVLLACLPSKNVPRKPLAQSSVTQYSVAILIPAHNESSNILDTLHSVKQQLSANISVLVVADNCNDDTAEVARNQGVAVIERFDAAQRGKGYALDFGLKRLAQHAPDVVMILDADCLLGENGVSILAYDALHYQRPIQGLYLMHADANASLKTKIAEFAWTVKNWVRPLGFYRLGLPCQLMGSGMAFPWAVIRQVNLASGHIAEDMKLGVDLARLNFAPRFCPDALITSRFPVSEEGIQTQRTRWEHGHIGMILKEGPLLVSQSIQHMNLNMLALSFDMCVPPLALLVLVATVLFVIGFVFFLLTQQLIPWLLPFAYLLLVGLAVMLAWLKFGRKILSLSALMQAPFYVLVKIPLYIKYMFKRQTEWVRSKRDL